MASSSTTGLEEVGTVAVEIAGAAAVVTLAGEHDMATIDAVERALAAAERVTPDPLVVDLSACTFIDSTIVRTLLLARERAARPPAHRLALVLPARVASSVATVFRVSGLDGAFATYASPALAIRA